MRHTKLLSAPRQSHGKTNVYLVCYLKKMHDLGLKFKTDPIKGFECYCDANFSENWNKAFASVDHVRYPSIQYPTIIHG